MQEIVFFSDNKDLIEEIRHILGRKSFDVSIFPLSKIKDHKPPATGLILIELVYSREDAFSVLKDLEPWLATVKNKKLALLSDKQIADLLPGLKKFDDYIYLEDLGKDLLNRVSFNLQGGISTLDTDSLAFDDMLLNLDKYELIVEGETIVLTFKEFEMLKLLMQNKNKVFTRNNLLSKVWGYDYYGGSRTVDVHMRRLRSKIPTPYNNMLKTIRNVGYMFSPKN